ncbi:lysozyme family protein [Sphingopyxis panaciterrae]|uniref:glycoside hydrolase family 108 protein n=1 Tax=Sphingopyxis panaciterrae TaxID=363841 RepID=UPI001421191F|nr:glycosyl hydrolase 108 family protein [Sphingopyxis panaciterrae]NIJ37928.1 lysozyme family protein [Sphingopyxis panaciterrae]
MSIETMIDATIGKEGGYSNHPADKGGPTRWGMTERVARANGYQGDMRTLPRETAVAIYRLVYAIRPGFAAVAEIDSAVGEELFDTGVNMGPSVPALWFQQALNALNDGGKLYADIKEDGDIGPATLGAFRAYLRARGSEASKVMLRALNAMQGARYIELSRMRVANEAFTYGWLRTRVAV